jgi:hypothetical protein
MRLIQFRGGAGGSHVGCIDPAGSVVSVLADYGSVYELALAAIARRQTLEQAVAAAPRADEQPYKKLLEGGQLRPPLTHPDPARCLVSGTGLTHLGSAATRDGMHVKGSEAADEVAPTDSMQMFLWGIAGGKPPRGQVGAQPEWFYKGNGRILVGSHARILAPQCALDYGEEPELVGLYVIGPKGTPARLGFALGNEFSDHVTERRNYLYLAHSKLRQCSVGPELRTGVPPANLEGRSRIRRDGEIIWERPFHTGEGNMCHSFENLEFHHFKYLAHRVPGDVHVHFFGTATLSFADGIRAQPGDRYEIELPEFGAPLVNTLDVEPGSLAPGCVLQL